MTTGSGATYLFPCPFCGSGSVHVVGGGQRFLHYRCETCAEFWTGMRLSLESPRSIPSRPKVSAPKQDKVHELIH